MNQSKIAIVEVYKKVVLRAYLIVCMLIEIVISFNLKLKSIYFCEFRDISMILS